MDNVENPLDTAFRKAMNELIDTGPEKFKQRHLTAIQTAARTDCMTCELRKTCDLAFHPYNINVEPMIDCLAAK